MLGLKLNHVSKRGHCSRKETVQMTVQLCLAWCRCCRLKSTHCFLFFFSPMDLAKGKSSRVALSAAFAILTSRLMRLLLHGDIYWDFPGMEDPEYAEKMSFLRSMWNKTDSRPVSLRMYSRLCFIMQCCDYVVISSRWIHMIALHTLHGYVTDTGTMILLPQRLWSKPGVHIFWYIYIYIYIYICECTTHCCGWVCESYGLGSSILP